MGIVLLQALIGPIPLILVIIFHFSAQVCDFSDLYLKLKLKFNGHFPELSLE